MALLLVILAFLGFVVLGAGSGSTGVKDSATSRLRTPHHVSCKARMSAGESRRDCGGPPVNP
jgi:hypothetical protein